ncbi:unnamed protein product [Plutella xylostella]|uniref:(diamondback moth) hypothetical protein n=1 Tax=Plutella xylostella TaxID=51655 RepID=A0A8S4FN56_PLUXY|nr:unnamed protein product [Plutella xylostella]
MSFQQQQPSTPVKQPASVDNKPTAPASPAPVSGIQQAHLQQKTVQENEQFAVAWLRASYEPLPPTDNSTTDAAEIYRQYAACCSNMQRKGVIAPQHFPRLVRDLPPVRGVLLQHAAQGGDSAAALPPACAVSDSDSDSDNSTTDAAEIYRQYAACCSNMQRKGVIAPQHFPRLVR